MERKFLSELILQFLGVSEASPKKDDSEDGLPTPIPTTKIVKVRKLMAFTDLRLDFVKELTTILESKPITSSNSSTEEIFMKNFLQIVKAVASEKNFGVDCYFDPESEYSKAAVAKSPEENYKDFKRCFSVLWTKVMKWSMTPSVYKAVVTMLPDKIMLHLTKPLHMSDFLMEAFKLGGVFSVISLHGIFLLMQTFNFEVPDFYIKLYSMLTPQLMWTKYRDRYFAYASTFLSSTHLPEYLVGAFVKRVSRLSLHSPSHILPMICDFIVNLMILHPGLKTLVSKQSPASSKLEKDPFDFEETDPAKCKALESCLWEIKTLQLHSLPHVANSARFISKALPKVAKDIGESLSSSYEEMRSQINNDENESDNPLIQEDDLTVLFKEVESQCENYIENMAKNAVKRSATTAESIESERDFKKSRVEV